MKLAKKIINGDREEEFAMASNYAEILMVHNPGSTVVLHVDSAPNPLQRRFERMYVFLNACVSGFRNGCTPFSDFDGCFLKGPDGGHLLCAVTRDANDSLLPIPYACVEAENAPSWAWFIKCLAVDVGNDKTLSIMSEKHKVS